MMKTLLFATGGALVGGIRASYTSGDTFPEDDLSEPYLHLQKDVTLLHALRTLDADIQTTDPVAGIRTIVAADALVGLRYALTSRAHPPALSDRVDGLVRFRTAKEAMQRFVTAAEASFPAKEVVHIQRLAVKVIECLEGHLQAVILATREIYIHP